MSKFKVGDKVRTCVQLADAHKFGRYGIGPDELWQDEKTRTVLSISGRNMDTTCRLSDDHINLEWPEYALVSAEPRREFIVIRRDGEKTIAELRHDREVIKSGTAICNASDTFDFQTGAKLAFDRLIGREEPKPAPAPEPPKYYTGKVVCIESNNPSRVGIVASMKDGICSRGGWNRLSGIPYKSFDDFCSAWIDSKFAEAKE